ncbi:MAG: hypothetical protein QXE41_03485 [Acidilobaceae archaeon]
MISFLIIGILLFKPKEVCERLSISYTTLLESFTVRGAASIGR